MGHKDIQNFKTGKYQGTQTVTYGAYVDVRCPRLRSKKKCTSSPSIINIVY